jgi:hypothetical protein
MPIGNVDVRLRPIRLGFLLDPRDRASVLRAIRINSFLWGGQYNPLIPVSRRFPARKRASDLRPSTPLDLAQGYIDAFDPDYLVPVGRTYTGLISAQHRHAVEIGKILETIHEDRTPQYGIGLFELLDQFIGEELRFVRTHPFRFIIPSSSRADALFVGALFGLVPEEAAEIFSSSYEPELPVEKPACSLDDYFEYLQSETWFVRRICGRHIEKYPAGNEWREMVLFLMNTRSSADVVQYWNLRAMGLQVVPVPKADVYGRNLIAFLKTVVDDAYQHRARGTLFATTLIASDSVSDEEAAHLVEGLGLPARSEGQPSHLGRAHYPRIWDEWLRNQGSDQPWTLDAGRTSYQLGETERQTFRALAPRFMSRHGGHGTQRFANEIQIRVYGATEPTAEVMPEGPSDLVRAVGAIGFDEWRFGPGGLVYLGRHKEWDFSLKLPKGEDVFREWLKTRGWTAKLSSAGLIARQMLKQLNGVRGLSRLANKRTIELLAATSEGKPMGERAFWGEVRRIANAERHRRDPTFVLRGFTEARMFQLGIELQCPICTQRTWYSMRDADYEFQCPKCLDRFPLPAHAPREIIWAYRALGPFSLPGKSYGVYTVLLLLRFFSQILDGGVTSMLSFEAEKPGTKIEADLGLMFRDRAFWRRERETIFCECKTFDVFKPRDIARMRVLAREFPGAILVFATLNLTLTAGEKRLLKPFAMRGRRIWKANRTRNPVLIVTGNELFTDERPERRWEEIGGAHKEMVKTLGRSPGVNRLADVTQQLYLGLRSWHEWYEDYWRKRLRRKQTS